MAGIHGMGGPAPSNNYPPQFVQLKDDINQAVSDLNQYQELLEEFRLNPQDPTLPKQIATAHVNVGLDLQLVSNDIEKLSQSGFSPISDAKLQQISDAVVYATANPGDPSCQQQLQAPLIGT